MDPPDAVFKASVGPFPGIGCNAHPKKNIPGEPLQLEWQGFSKELSPSFKCVGHRAGSGKARPPEQYGVWRRT